MHSRTLSKDTQGMLKENSQDAITMGTKNDNSLSSVVNNSYKIFHTTLIKALKDKGDPKIEGENQALSRSS